MLFRRREKKEETLPALVEQPAPQTMLPADTTDAQIVALWLKQHASQSQDAYARDLARFLDFLGAPQLRAITLPDLQRFKDYLAEQGLSRATIARRLSAVKSLLSFCAATGYLPLNVGAAIKPPKAERKLAERIMSESSTQRLLALETNPRNHAILRLLYNAGLRVSELCALTWADVQERGTGGQIRAFGKGEKERYVQISAETYEELLKLRLPGVTDSAPVFTSRKRGHLSRDQVGRIVKAAALRAGIALDTSADEPRSKVSPHWLRHAHASHALEKGAPITLVRDTLGHANVTTTNEYAHARAGQSSGSYLAV